MEIRRRNRTITNSSWSGDGRKDSREIRSRGAKIDRGFTKLIAFVSVISLSTLLAVIFFPDRVPSSIRDAIDFTLQSTGLEEKVHAVIFDAGSTGTRMLAFTFHRGILDRQLRLDDELWLQVKPGLSSYADNPKGASKGIKEMLEKAKEKIPSSSWGSTPTVLKATAGLRLLPQAKSDAILREVEIALKESGFQPEENLIEILNPMYEGMFAWFTVNFLTGRINAPLSETFVTLDLGGGSTQITFAPSKPVHGLHGRKHFIHNVTVLQRPENIYSHSYLGLGLMAAREAIFKSESYDNESSVIMSSCVNSKEPLNFSFQGKEYTVKSDKNSSFENCIKHVNKVVNKENVHVAEELLLRDIVGVSYFFDKALERRLIPKATEGVIQIANFIEEAQRACDPYANSEFYCVDLAFISSLLTKGYGFPPEKEIYVVKKIRGHETSWALGLAFNILEQ